MTRHAMIWRLMARRLMSDNSGLAIVEFAFAAPLLISMFCGVYLTYDMVTCAGKVSQAARTISDLTTQYHQISTAQITAVLSNSGYVLSPYDVSQAKMRVSEVQITDISHAKVVWSMATSNGVALSVGATVNLPTGMAPPLMIPDPTAIPARAGGYLIVGETSYAYSPAFAQGWVQPATLYNRYFMLPRYSLSVDKVG